MLGKVMTLVSGLALGACSVVGVRDGTEEPPYTVVGQIGEAELRDYGPRIAAETVVDGPEWDALSAGFRRIAGYIFGANTASTKIAMTAPVAQTSQTIEMTAPVAQTRDAQGHWVVQFFMPAKWTLETLPEPSDTSVRLVTVPPQRFAVVRFTGWAGPQSLAEHRTILLAALSVARKETIGAPVSWLYDPPWTIPFFRRNEVAVQVKP